tara:strand:+ start:135 stop:815 length:681 start_codon:yes stop_codon:yes gene_type:complete
MRTIVIAPHADDELLGCGGTLLKRGKQGSEIAWILMTTLLNKDGWSVELIRKREHEIEMVRKGLKINENNLFKLGFSPTKLDQTPIANIVERISKIFIDFQPDEVFLPYPGDIHSDHRITFEAALSCTKWFRYPFIKRIYTYETLSETEFGVDPRYQTFRPNTFIDISGEIDKKIELMKIYSTEIKDHPFPRSILSIQSKAFIRGSEMGTRAAEAFCLLTSREIDS